MGKVSDKGMEGKDPNDRSVKNNQTRNTEGDWTSNATNVSSSNDSDESRLFRCISHTASTSSEGGGGISRLAASASSPSLLTGCGNSSTHVGADIERHVHAHNVQIVSSSPPLSPIPVSPLTPSPQTDPFPTTASSIPHPPSSMLPSAQSDIPTPPDSVFLTPALPRPQHLIIERPSSAPSYYLEKISGTLLRLVGDHYLCSTCGRQLRTIGDQLTMETNINHIRRAFSASHLDRDDNAS